MSKISYLLIYLKIKALPVLLEGVVVASGVVIVVITPVVELFSVVVVLVSGIFEKMIKHGFINHTKSTDLSTKVGIFHRML